MNEPMGRQGDPSPQPSDPELHTLVVRKALCRAGDTKLLSKRGMRGISVGDNLMSNRIFYYKSMNELIHQ
jgi:hypothetical protein